jgi:hypothetical protein
MGAWEVTRGVASEGLDPRVTCYVVAEVGQAHDGSLGMRTRISMPPLGQGPTQ